MARFLILARAMKAQADLQTLGPPEAVYRSVVSRAYYAAFGHAHDFAVQWLRFLPRTKPEERSQDHGRLQGHFKSRRRWNVAKNLGHLRDFATSAIMLLSFQAKSQRN
jgi:hypothetical protein